MAQTVNSNRPLNILLISQYLVGGGLERMVRQLGTSLASDYGCHITLFSFDGDDDLETRRELAAKGITAIHEKKPEGFAFSLVVRLARLIRDKKIDVIHTHESAPLIYATVSKYLSLRFPKIIHTQHSFVHLRTHPYIRHYDRWFQTSAAFLTAVSSQVREEYTKIGVGENRVRVISNGVEFPEATLARAEKLAQRAQLVEKHPALADRRNDLWLISMARVHPGKGQDHLIRLWAALSEQVRSHSVLIFAGPETSPGEKARLQEILRGIPNADRVVFIGNTSQPIAWLQASDLFLSGSEYEGMPLAPIEARGCGLPLVLSSVRGHLLMGSEASYFELNDPADGAGKVEAVIGELQSNPREFDRRNGQSAAQIRSNYSVRHMAGEYYGLYRDAKGLSAL